MLKQRIQDEMKNAMLAREDLKTSVLRMLKSEVVYFEIQKGGAGYEATDEDVLTVIQKAVKQRKDSIEQYTAGKRQDLADKEAAELTILQKYLPSQLSEGAIDEIVTEVITQSGAKNIQDMGKVMGILSVKVKGKADMGLVSKLVREKLQV